MFGYGNHPDERAVAHGGESPNEGNSSDGVEVRKLSNKDG